MADKPKYPWENEPLVKLKHIGEVPYSDLFVHELQPGGVGSWPESVAEEKLASGLFERAEPAKAAK